MTKKITTREIEQHFESKYCDSKKHAYFTELRLGIGGPSEQRVDGFLLNLFQSENYDITIFEFKTSRSDFLAELRNPIKRQYAVDLSNRFVFVTGIGVVENDSEIPEGCGWWVFDGHRLIERIAAEVKTKPEAAPWALMASVMRRSFRVRDKHAQTISDFVKALDALKENHV